MDSFAFWSGLIIANIWHVSTFKDGEAVGFKQFMYGVWVVFALCVAIFS